MLLSVSVSVALCTVIDTRPAQAAGDTSCGKPWTNQAGTVYTCDLWPSASIPVLAQPDGRSAPVGVLNEGGWANWFTSQTQGATYTAHGYENNWWAHTMADNGRWGYVSEVYFAQGANFERDARLPVTGQASPPPPQGPPGSLGTPGPGEPNLPAADRCGPAQALRLRVSTSSSGLSGPGGKGEGAPVSGEGNRGPEPDPGASDTEVIGTLQNCVHRVGNEAYGRTFMHLNPGWNIYSRQLIIDTSMRVHGGHSPGAGSLSVLDPPGTEQPGKSHRWYLTRASGGYSAGRADDGYASASRPANGTFVWDTKPTSFSASATYEVDAYVLISTGTAFIDNRPKPFGLRYAGWSPAQGKPRSRAMADLSWSWRSGPLSF